MLTPDQELQAKKEGWKVVNGYVARAFDSRGLCPFTTLDDIVRFLYEKSKTSDWHRDVYINLPWNGSDNALALKEGWMLCVDRIFPYANSKFSSNEAAQAYVQTGIDAGDPLHLKAIKTLAKRRLLYGDQ